MDTAASVLSILDFALKTTSAIIKFANDTYHASAERKLLSEEATSLHKIIEAYKIQIENARYDHQWFEVRKNVFNQFENAFADLAKALKLDIFTGQVIPEGRFRTALTSAKWAFSKEEFHRLLERTSRLRGHILTLVSLEQSSTLDHICQNQEEANHQKLRSKMVNWFSPLQMSRFHEAAAEEAVEGTGTWFLNSSEYKDWRARPGEHVWCAGIPGVGKTVLSSIIVNDLYQYQRDQMSSNKQIAVVFISFKYDRLEQTLNKLVGCILRQLTENLRTIPNMLQESYELHGCGNFIPSSRELSELLSCLADIYDGVFFVVDALDECVDKTRWEFVEMLRTISKAHILITSRPLDDISEELDDFRRVDIKANKFDIETFIDHVIGKSRNLRKRIKEKPSLRMEIKVAVVQTAEDMFLIARLHMDSLEDALSVNKLREKLQTLPSKLNDAYMEAIKRIQYQSSEHMTVAMKILAWVSHAFRAMSTMELKHALAIEPGVCELDEDDLIDDSSITTICAGLIVVDSRTDTVNLAHKTAKDFLYRHRFEYFPNFHAIITMSCATYLALPDLQNAKLGKIIRKYPLACYATEFMGSHVRENPEESLEHSVLDTMCQLLSYPEKRKALLYLLTDLDLIKSGFFTSDETFSDSMSTFSDDVCTLLGSEHEEIEGKSVHITERGESALIAIEGAVETRRIPEVTALHIAASMGLARVAAMLLSDCQNIDALDGTGKTALEVAIEKGFENAVDFLINNGANVDLEKEHGQTVLLLALEKKWNKVAQAIVSKSRSTTENMFVSKLLIAIYDCNSNEFASLMVERQSPNKLIANGATLLFIAVECNHDSMVRNIVTSGVDVNIRSSIGQTALHRATRRKDIQIMKTLLDLGALVDVQDDDGHTAWSANAEEANEGVLNILLEAGANPSIKGPNGISELYKAAADGKIDYVRFLLKSGTNPSIKTNYNWAPLHWAANNGHTECVKLLIGAGAATSPLSDQHTTPLDLALRANHVQIAHILREAGAKESQALDVDALSPTSPIKLLESMMIDHTLNEENDDYPFKISMVFDEPITETLTYGQFIYAENVPGNRDPLIYQISHQIDTVVDAMKVRRAVSRPKMADYPLLPDQFPHDDLLFEIIPKTQDWQLLHLRGNSQSPLPGIITMERSWSGGWKVHEEYQGTKLFLFRTRPDSSYLHDGNSRWVNEDDKLLARDGKTGNKDAPPRIVFEASLDSRLRDVLFTCWIARLWVEHLTMQRHGNINGSACSI